MVFTSLKLSKDARLFSGSPLKFRAIKRPLSDEEEDMEVDDSWLSMDAQFDESATDQNIFTEKKWFLKTTVSNRVLPLLFHKTLSYEVKSCAYANKFDSYDVEMKGRHASELCSLINGLDELSKTRPYNTVYDMDLKAFFDENRSLIHDIAKELMPNPNNAMEPYVDPLDQEDQCRVIYVMLWSVEHFCKWDHLAEKILSEKKKIRNWPAELKQMLAKKLIKQTSTQQGFYKRSTSEYNSRCLPAHSSSLLPLRLVNASFKCVAEKGD
ncbi:hypothetical protein M3Y97_00331200 [Aphelenchoides bicaudatus]|nr:hypothetical protein M3Y97_00331200 [Aphelenchoides bicaudatus]